MNNSRNYPVKATNPIQTTRPSVDRLLVDFRYPEGLYERRRFSVVLGEMQFYLLLFTNHTSQLSGILQAPTLYECFYLSSVIAIQKIESLTNFDLEYAVKTKYSSL